MKKNKLGKSDIYISELTLGCMSLGTDEKKAESMIDFALNQGINHLDTADLYDFGRNEELIGKAIKKKRDQIILTTKVGNHFKPGKDGWFWDPSKEHILNGVKDSLKRLQTDYIDLYMLHGGTIDDPIDESIDAFEQLKKEGYIRAYGISSIRPNVIREYVKRSSIDAVMMQYNLLDRRPEEEILNLLAKHGISVLARGPIAKGMLSNLAKEQLEKKGSEGYLDYSHDELSKIIEELTDLLKKETDSLQAIALKYVLKHPSVASAVFGASNIDQIKENLSIDHSAPLTDRLYQRLQAITKPIQYNQHT